ncbi:MAG: polyketide synthase dehydratase domain-containing protein, partial [Acidobacteriota bacterium]
DVFVEKLPYDRGYHTPAFTYVCEPLRKYFSSLRTGSAGVPLYSCTTARLYPTGPEEILNTVADTFARPLLFRQTVEAMYDAGARIFVESGPRGNLTAFVDDILRGRPHLCVAIDQHRRGGILALNHALAMLAAAGVPLDTHALYDRRAPRRLSFDVAEDRVSDPDTSPGTVRISLCYPRLGVPEPLPVPVGATAAVSYAEPPEAGPVAALQTDPLHAYSLLDEHVAVMEEMLRTHEDVMLASFGAAPSPGYRNGAPAQAKSIEYAAEKSVAARNIPVEEHAAPEERARPETAVADKAAPASLREILLRAVADRTGYPLAMLGLDMDMEAELGIDSIKRVEILGVLGEAAQAANLPVKIDIEQASRLRTLREVMQFFEAADTPPGHDPLEALRRSPLIRGSAVISHEAGRSIQLRCRIEPAEHLYLEDHCLYFQASDQGSQASPLLSIPMTISLEIMAETASLLSPGQLVTGARDVQALKWINVKKDASEVVLLVRAVRSDAEGVTVTIRPESSGAGDAGGADLLAQATILFGAQYPAQPERRPFQLKNAHEPLLKGRAVYSEHLMFHGPRFQGISNLEETGDDGVQGVLTVLPVEDLLRSDQRPDFHIDPFLLDAAGQMVGYWPCEYLEEGYVVLPIRIARISLHRKNPVPGTPVRCQVRMGEVSRRQLRGDIELFTPDGDLWMRVTGWEDWRFYWEKHIHDFWRFPARFYNGKAVDLPWLEEQGMVCQRIEPMSEMDKSGLWEVLWMHMILNREELSEYQAIGNQEHRAGWIFERATAKDAARRWAKQQYGCQIYPADIQVGSTPAGVLTVNGAWTSLGKTLPSVSACLFGNSGFGIAGPRPAGLAVIAGSDSEPCPPGKQDFGDFSEAELALVEAAGSNGIRCRAAAARQAAKHLLRLTGRAAHSVAITAFDSETGCIHLVAQGAASDTAFRITAECHCVEGMVVAAAISPESGPQCK